MAGDGFCPKVEKACTETVTLLWNDRFTKAKYLIYTEAIYKVINTFSMKIL